MKTLADFVQFCSDLKNRERIGMDLQAYFKQVAAFSFSFSDKTRQHKHDYGEDFSPGVSYHASCSRSGELHLDISIYITPYQDDRFESPYDLRDEDGNIIIDDGEETLSADNKEDLTYEMMEAKIERIYKDDPVKLTEMKELYREVFEDEAVITDTVKRKLDEVKEYEQNFLEQTQDEKFCWSIFETHATFKDIFGEDPVALLNQASARMIDYFPVPLECENLMHLNITFGSKETMAYVRKNEHTYRDMLSAICHDPMNLRRSEVAADNLIWLMTAARWSLHSEDSKFARALLKKYLHQYGRKKPLPPPELMNIMLEVTERLAEHLSSRCRDMGYVEGRGPTLKEEDYAALMEWANTNEPRIMNFSIDELSTLIFRPAEYAKDRLEAYLNASNKTKYRRNSEAVKSK